MPNTNITISVKTEYIANQSMPELQQYLFAYTITIKNNGSIATKLLNRHWQITDADNKVQEVFGKGVVGKQPYLQPGDSFTYTSSAVLATAKGHMLGYYEMVTDDGDNFHADIPAFSLNTPTILN